MTKSRLLVLFDLDGTLVDPAGAITGGIVSALTAHGLPMPGADELRRMVGPPLAASLRETARVPENDLGSVIEHYRAAYRSHGMAGSRPYPGVIDVVRALRAAGHLVAVATQKPQGIARELLRVQKMDGLFHSIHGSPDEEQAPVAGGKTPIIAAALAAHVGQHDGAIMVGDRSHDITGASANGLACIAVTWGFGSAGEFHAAGASAVAGSSAQLLEQILHAGLECGPERQPGRQPERAGEPGPERQPGQQPEPAGEPGLGQQPGTQTATEAQPGLPRGSVPSAQPDPECVGHGNL